MAAEWFNNINQEGQDEIISWEIFGDLTQGDVDGLKNLWFRDLPLKRARLQHLWANHPKRQQAAAQQGRDSPPSPGDKNVMFMVAIVKWKNKKLTTAAPVGTAFAISDELICTASHNTENGGMWAKKIGLLTEVEDRGAIEADLIVATLVEQCTDYDEDWAIYKRVEGRFSCYALVCPENELPNKSDKVGVRDYPIGLNMSTSSSKISLQSTVTKVSQYEAIMKDNEKKRKRKIGEFKVVKSLPIQVEPVIQVVGGRVKGCCGGAYFNSNGKVVAFHKESLDDSDVTSATSSHSHTSYSAGYVLCRLPKFKIWYNQTFPDREI